MAGHGAPLLPRLGMHVSISGGMDKMAERAVAFGCEAVQVFSRSPQGGKARPLTGAEVEAARRTLDAAGIQPLVVHVPYFANLCAADDGLRGYAVETLAGEFERAGLLGAPFVVTHPGRPAGGVDPADSRRLALASLAEALAKADEAAATAGGGSTAAAGTPGSARPLLLLENTAGMGRELGSTLEELAELAAGLEKAPGGGHAVGLCLDTCHAHAAGYDLSGLKGVSALARRILDLFGPGKLRVVHANDSRGATGSRLDRHAPVGQGTIGDDGFRALMAEPLFAACPFLLETPGSDEERAADLERLRRLRTGEDLGDRAARAPGP